MDKEINELLQGQKKMQKCIDGLTKDVINIKNDVTNIKKDVINIKNEVSKNTYQLSHFVK